MTGAVLPSLLGPACIIDISWQLVSRHRRIRKNDDGLAF